MTEFVASMKNKAMEELNINVAEREAEAERLSDEQREALHTVVEELLALAFGATSRFADMQEILVNHKREV